jgi:hypothetical protein
VTPYMSRNRKQATQPSVPEKVTIRTCALRKGVAIGEIHFSGSALGLIPGTVIAQTCGRHKEPTGSTTTHKPRKQQTNNRENGACMCTR